MADTHYLGIVAKKNLEHESGYEVAKHVTEADGLLKVELYSGEKTYHPLNLPKTQKELPGQKLVDHINQYHLT